MYESPIKVDGSYSLAEEAEQEMRKLINAEEAHIMYKVNLVVDVDKEELIKALRYDRNQYEKGYSDRDSEIVRCKDCIHNPHCSNDDICPFVDSDGYVKEFPNDDFFCRYGKRRDDEEA